MDRAVKAAGGAFDEGPWGTMSGLESLKDYTQVKSVWVELSVQTRDPFTDERQR